MKASSNKKTPLGEYELDFYDGFDEEQIDRSKWVEAYLPQWSTSELAKPTYRLTGDGLALRIGQDQKPWCPEFDGSIRVSSLQTGVYSGELGSGRGQHHFRPDLVVREVQEQKRLYTPRFGYIELRAKCRLSPHHLAALWLIGFEDEPERSAEICVVELKGSNVGERSARMGYGLRPFADTGVVNEFFEDEIPIDVRQANTYSVEWTRNSLLFRVNDTLIRTVKQSPQYEMQLMLNIYDLKGDSRVDAEFLVDYVVGYRNTAY